MQLASGTRNNKYNSQCCQIFCSKIRFSEISFSTKSVWNILVSWKFKLKNPCLTKKIRIFAKIHTKIRIFFTAQEIRTRTDKSVRLATLVCWLGSHPEDTRKKRNFLFHLWPLSVIFLSNFPGLHKHYSKLILCSNTKPLNNIYKYRQILLEVHVYSIQTCIF